MDELKPTARRLDSIDLLKCLAICAVLLIHCSANRFAMFDVGSNRWLATCFYGCISRWAVPLFLMCSGALMNDPSRDLPLKKLFSRYLLRLALALSVWAGLYELLRIYLSWGSAPLYQLLLQSAKNWCTGRTWYHLYYFYFAIALYLALPLTRLVARYATESELRLILILWFTCGTLIPLVKQLPLGASLTYSLLRYTMTSITLTPGLGLLGWYLRQHPPKHFRGGALLFSFGFAVTFLGVWRQSSADGTLNQTMLDGFSLFVLLMAVGLFRLAQRWTAAHPVPAFVPFLSRASFCVYLIHPFFQRMVMPEQLTAIAPYWGVPLQVGILLTLSLASYAVLRKIPLVNRWLI